MADQHPQGPIVRGIDYKSTFPFTQIFRSFRAAVHPSKLILALVAMLLIYLGGSILDAIWPGRGAVPGEIELYADSRDQADPAGAFARARDLARKSAEEAYRARLIAAVYHHRTRATTQPVAPVSAEEAEREGSFSMVRRHLLHQRDDAVKRAKEAYDAEVKRLDEVFKAVPDEPREAKRRAADARDEALREARNDRDDAIRSAYRAAYRQYVESKQVRGAGLYETFVAHQIGQVNAVIGAVRDGRWLGRGGVIDSIVAFFTIGPVWAMRHHPIFFTLFFLLFLSVWAVFGGAIARISAVHIARDEKISIRQALRFSTAKFLSFLSAPIIPPVIVLGVGLVVSVGGLLANVPFVGPIVVGALFFLALVAGFVMTLVMLGLAGGFNLMYPTIAVEGSDSFDAISRSFSYLYARPWRLAFYTGVALLYGGLTYMFIRYFLELLLMLTHFFAGLLVFGQADSGNPNWSMLWPGPVQTGRLAYSPEYFSMGLGTSIGAFFIWVWTQLLAGLLGAFAISFYFVANTVIYFLMRKEVDATELDDVYLEQGDEDFADALPPATVPATATAGGASTPASGESPAGQQPG